MAQTEAQRKAKQKYDSKNYKTIGIKCPIEEYNIISRIAKNNNQTASMFSRECIKHFLESHYNVCISIPTIQNDVPKKLFNLRNEHKLSPSDVANEFNITRAEYDYYESGTKNPPLDILLKACKLYNVPQSYFGINSDLQAVGNKGYFISNTETSETLEVTDIEFEMIKKIIKAFRGK